MTLYSGLEHKLNMALFGNKEYRKESDNLDNPGRRNFLGTTAKGALALGLGGTGFLKPENALAYNIRDLPPGFWPEVCKDEELRTVFGWMYTGGSVTGNVINKYTQADISMKLSKWINPNTPLTEPAYWFTLCYYNYKWQDAGWNGLIDTDATISKFNLNKKSAMYNWALGINAYYRTWIAEKKTGTPMETEIYLLKAIFTAAGRNENVINDYRILDITNKTIFLQGIMKDLEKQSKTNQLIAAWSSFMYGNHESKKLNDKDSTPEGKIINQIIEVPLRKYIPKIRGPPYYNI